MNLNYLELIRMEELRNILEFLRDHYENPMSLRILEIGAGTGWQAKKIAELGCTVEAIDLDNSNYLGYQIWPITRYDGKTIPFPENHFDLVFSSNVLEHILHVVEFQSEIQRVLKPQGIAIHILPSATWRFWTNLAHYPYVLIRILKGLVLCKQIMTSNTQNTAAEHTFAPNPRSGKLDLLRKALFPPRHGEFGNSISELYYFKKTRWEKLFVGTGWKINRIYTNKLTYSGYVLFGTAISISTRRFISSILGSSCNIFILSNMKSVK